MTAIVVTGRGIPSTVVETDQANTYTTGAQSLAAATSLLVPTSAAYAPTADGSIGYDSTQDRYAAGGAGAVVGYFPRLLYATNAVTEGNVATQADTSGTGGNEDVASGTAGTSELIFASKFTIPANFLIANKVLRVTVLYDYTTSASPPTGTARLKLGSTNICSTAAGTLTSSLTARGVGVSFLLQGTAAVGASVAVEGNVIGTTGRLVDGIWGAGTSTITANVATNGTLALQTSWQWGAATAANSIRLRQFMVEELN